MTTVLMTAAAEREFTALPRPIQARVLAIQDRLWKWPAVAGAKPLRGDLAGRYRIRTGDYRVQFHVEQARSKETSRISYTIVIERIGHRDGFYED